MVRYQNILLDELSVAHEKTRTGHAIVVIILTVDLLVIVAAAESVHGESGATVGVGKTIVTHGNHAGHKQRQVVQAFVFLHTGKRSQCDAGEGVGHLGLGRLDQGGASDDFYGRVGFTYGQLDGSQVAISARSYQYVILHRGLETRGRNFKFIVPDLNETEPERAGIVCGGCQYVACGCIGRLDLSTSYNRALWISRSAGN